MAKDKQPFELEHLIEDALNCGLEESRIIEILANNLSQVAINRVYNEITSELKYEEDFEEEDESPVELTDMSRLVLSDVTLMVGLVKARSGGLAIN